MRNELRRETRPVPKWVSAFCFGLRRFAGAMGCADPTLRLFAGGRFTIETRTGTDFFDGMDGRMFTLLRVRPNQRICRDHRHNPLFRQSAGRDGSLWVCIKSYGFFKPQPP